MFCRDDWSIVPDCATYWIEKLLYQLTFHPTIVGVSLACVLALASCGTFPKFRAIPPYVKIEDQVPVKQFVEPLLPTAWYASWPTGMRMTLIGRHRGLLKRFKMNCHTEQLKEVDYLTKVSHQSFMSSNLDCQNLAETPSILRKSPINFVYSCLSSLFFVFIEWWLNSKEFIFYWRARCYENSVSLLGQFFMT